MSFMSSDQGKQMAEQWIPGILGSGLSKKDEAIFDTLHILLQELKNGQMLFKSINTLMNEVLEKHQRTQFRVSIISLPLPTTKKESWGGEKKDKHATYDVRDELNVNDQRVKNLAVWARCLIEVGAEKTRERLIAKNMISATSRQDQVLWALGKTKEFGYPIWNAFAGTPQWTTKANEKIKRFDKFVLWPLWTLVAIIALTLFIIL
jgi:hypothetical protein